MTSVEEVALAQIVMRGEAAVEETIRYVDGPGSDAENGERSQRRLNVYCARKTPGPQDCDRRRVEAEKVPVDGDGPQS
jgi:hypothetical protein